jgi:signal transduction histidine kinase
VLKVLIIEDSDQDIVLIKRHLESHFGELKFEQVDCFDDYVTQISSFQPDVILADYTLPNFDGMTALTALEEIKSDIPFVLVSGTIGEETVVEMLKRGAKDCVLKSNLHRLPSAIDEIIKGAQKQRIEHLKEKAALATLQKAQRKSDFRSWDSLTIKILMLEDDESDFQLAQSQFRHEKATFIFDHVENESDLRERLTNSTPDLILADFSLPSFDGLSALSIRNELQPDTPFIFLSGVVGEEVAIESMKLGASDYVLKDKLSRLVPVVLRAWEYSEERKRRKHVETALATERKRLQDELAAQVSNLEQANEDLKTARDEAVEANRMKTQFVANISHEIRTPMSGVLGILELLLHDHEMEEGEAHELTTLAFQSANSLMYVVNDLLDFSKLEAGRTQVVENKFNAVAILEEVIQSISTSAKKKDLEITEEVPDDLRDLSVVADARLIKQILLNLAHNAVKFTTNGSVHFQMERIATDDREVTLKYTVTDTGIGIATQDKSKLCQPFVQADGSTTRKYGGTGLGLSLCRGYAKLLGGKMGFDSTLGKGSSFWFSVPAKFK